MTAPTSIKPQAGEDYAELISKLRAGDRSTHAHLDARGALMKAAADAIEALQAQLSAERAAREADKARIKELEEAAREVLSHRVGQPPYRGWLPDTIETRKTLDALACLLGRQA